jgi:hypothetical protein
MSCDAAEQHPQMSYTIPYGLRTKWSKNDSGTTCRPSGSRASFQPGL